MPALDEMWSIGKEQLLPALQVVYTTAQQLDLPRLLADLPRLLQQSGLCQYTITALTGLGSELQQMVADRTAANPLVDAQLSGLEQPRGFDNSNTVRRHQKNAAGDGKCLSFIKNNFKQFLCICVCTHIKALKFLHLQCIGLASSHRDEGVGG